MNAETQDAACQLFELVLLVPQAVVEVVSDALEALDAMSVAVEDADAHTSAEQALFAEPDLPPPQSGWQSSRLLALFQSQAAALQAVQLLQPQDFFQGCATVTIRPVANEDWVRLTQAQFAPFAITPGFWIVPSWHEPPADASQVLRLDPGLAFGTGTHPTTRMCLRWIARQALTGQRVLDYGCGSGILAIASAKFGASDVVAVDIDPAAVASTRANASANQVQLQAGRPELAVGQFDVVLANILATPLKLLAPLLCRHVRPLGQLVLAGILERQADELQAAYAPWAQLEVAEAEDGWILMTAAIMSA